MSSKIEWTEETWNPTRGCRRRSAGCENCYAERQAIRHAGPGGHYEGLVRSTKRGPQWTGATRFVAKKLDEPFSWKKPRTVFVDSMSDLFFEGFTDDQIAEVFAVMALTERHTYQVLTKRAERLPEVLGSSDFWHRVLRLCELHVERVERASLGAMAGFDAWAQGVLEAHALPNVWIGVSVENQTTALERVMQLRTAPAAVRFISYEPALEHVRWRGLIDWGDIRWLIVGGESGPGARPCDLAWIRSTVEQCRAASVPVFVKQLGARPTVALTHRLPGCLDDADALDAIRSTKGGDPSEWPADLRVREMPEVARG